MAAIRIQLFGKMAVYADGRQLFAGVPRTKPLELLAYLLLYRRRTHPREVIAALLWPELPPVQAKRNLRKVLFTLQRFLAETVGPQGPQLLLTEWDTLALNPDVALELDVAVFEQACGLAQQRAAGELEPGTIEALSEAVALYEGELLAGIYEDWCLHERERLENVYLELLHTLMLHAKRQRAFDRAIQLGFLILQHDRANERAYRDLMLLYYQSGNRTAAIQQYRRCVAALVEEFGVRPAESTELLYKQICQDADAAAHPEPPRAIERSLGSAGAGRATEMHLLQLRAELQRMLRQLQDEIQHVEKLLNS